MSKAVRFFLCFSNLMAGLSIAQDGNALKFVVTTDYYSKYVWRGQNLNDKSVVQPAISVSAYGLTGSIWGNLDLTNKNDASGEFSEFDFALDYSGAMPRIDGLNFSAGTIYYRFPNTSFKPTTEVYGGLSIALPLSPSIKLYRDLDEIDGSYLQVGIGHTFEKLATWSEDYYCGLQLGAGIGWANSAYNNGYFGAGKGTFNDLTLSVGLPFCISSWTIKPGISYATMLADAIRDATLKSENLWMGVGLSTRF